MELVLIWCLFAVVSAVIAAARGLSPVLYGFLGLLLGPFGLLMACVIPSQPRAVAATTRAGFHLCPHGSTYDHCLFCAPRLHRDDLKLGRCTACHFEVSGEARYCPKCGEPVQAVTVECAGCRSEVPGDARYCPKCGRPL